MNTIQPTNASPVQARARELIAAPPQDADAVSLSSSPSSAAAEPVGAPSAAPPVAPLAGSASPALGATAREAVPAQVGGFQVSGTSGRPAEFQERSHWHDWGTARTALAGQLPTSTLERLDETWDFAMRCHGDQMRPNNEPYAVHLLEVLEILTQGAGVKDCDILQAGLLHDVVEDTGHSLDEIRDRFGPSVTELVDWMTKPEPKEGEDPAVVREGYLQRFAEAPEAAVTVKLADRLSNVQRLYSHPRPAKQRSYYRETVEQVMPQATRQPWFEGQFAAWQRKFSYLAE